MRSRGEARDLVWQLGALTAEKTDCEETEGEGRERKKEKRKWQNHFFLFSIILLIVRGMGSTSGYRVWYFPHPLVLSVVQRGINDHDSSKIMSDVLIVKC